MQISIDDARLKELFKEAIAETLHEKRGFIYNAIAEVIRDYGMANPSAFVSHEVELAGNEILKILERNQLKLNLFQNSGS
ncbi:MAG: hypothetical protein ACE5GL_09025 [Calditrichia bacterium]